MNSQDIIDHVFNLTVIYQDDHSLLGHAIDAAKETLQELIREDNAEDFYECAKCGCLITNDMEHQHKDGWFGS